MIVFLDYRVWQWKNEHNEWNAYAANSCVPLQRGLGKKSASVAIKARDTVYKVNLESEPWQQTNDETGVSREVTRIKSGGFHGNYSQIYG